MFEKINTSKIIKEDILRILGERGGKGSLKVIEGEVKASRLLISKIIDDLAKEGLLISKGEFVVLRERGKIEARSIVRKHLAIEGFFGRNRSKKEAHEIAHILEHYISEEVAKNIKKLSTLKRRSVPLSSFGKEKGLIADIFFDIDLLEKVVGMGIFPGEEIEIVDEVPNGIVVKVGDKKIVLSKNIAKEIKVSNL